MAERQGHLSPKAAETLAIDALTFLASEGELLSRFLALSGITPAGLRAAASEPGFLPGVLDFFLNHEPTLVAFAAHAKIAPADIAAARRALTPEDQGA
jgi:hypothetical protein